MSIRRVGSAALYNLRVASYTASPSTRLCSQCLPFPTAQLLLRPLPRRNLATATAYTPHDLHPQAPPPRNAGVPDTSITSTTPTAPSHTQRSTEKPNTSIQEGEAQKSKPLQQHQQQQQQQQQQQHEPITTTTATPSPTPPPKRRPKLRARKAAMSLTPAAVAQLHALLDQPSPKLIRIGVKNRGCSGLAYHLEYVDAAGTFDEAVDQDGVKVLIDSKALFSIIGSEMDWVEDKLSARFVFRNPNITEQCGCGESFSIS